MARWFDDPTGFFLTVALVLLVVHGVGHVARQQRELEDDDRSQITTVQGSVLALLGLLLGFTFSMALSRFDLRRQLVLKEANAIGTTYLRAALLTEPQRGEVERDLRAYVAARIDFLPPALIPSVCALRWSGPRSFNKRYGCRLRLPPIRKQISWRWCLSSSNRSTR